MATAAPKRVNVKYTRPWMYPKQKRAFFCRERYALVEASTKAGKTVGCIAWILEQALQGKAGQNCWWVAPIYGQAKIAYRRLKRTLPPALFRSNDSELTITLFNDVVIWFKGADNPDSLFGEDVIAAVIDEASRCKEEAFFALRSTLTATQGPMRIIGNVKGRGNWFYKLARIAEAGAENMHYEKITAVDAVAAGVFPQEEFDDARRLLPENVFRELYLAEASDDGGNPFGIAAIAACVGPLSTLPPQNWGVDLAKSEDWTVPIGMDVRGAVCRFERWQGPWEETIDRLDRMIGRTPTLVDSTGVGDPVLERLQRPTQGPRGLIPARPNFEGFKFTAQSKQQLMEGLAVAIQQREIQYPDGVIRIELEQFEYVYTRTGVHYSAPPGMHDDAVCGLALVTALHRRPKAAAFVGSAGGQRAPTPERRSMLAVR